MLMMVVGEEEERRKIKTWIKVRDSIESVTKEGKDLRAVMSDGGKHWACDCLLEEGSLVNPDYVN